MGFQKKFKNKYVWVAPVFAALVYPFILMTLFHSGKLLRDATKSIDTAIAISPDGTQLIKSSHAIVAAIDIAPSESIKL